MTNGGRELSLARRAEDRGSWKLIQRLIQDSSPCTASTVNLVYRDVNETENTTKSCVRRGYVRDEIRLLDVKKIFFFPSIAAIVESRRRCRRRRACRLSSRS